MIDQPPCTRPDRPALPCDSFRAQCSAAGSSAGANTRPVVVTSDCGDARGPMPTESPEEGRSTGQAQKAAPQRKTDGDKVSGSRNPLKVYGERSTSRPYALRLPEPIDLALRQIAVEERTHPMRIVDRLILDHLASIGRLPPLAGGT